MRNTFFIITATLMLYGCATQAQIEFAKLNKAADEIAARYPADCKGLATEAVTKQKRDYCEQAGKELIDAIGRERDAACKKLHTQMYTRPVESLTQQELNFISFCKDHIDHGEYANHDRDAVYHDAYHQ